MTEGVNPKDLLGVKKSPLRFVPPSLMVAVAPVLALGAAKYGEKDADGGSRGVNWRQYPVKQMIYLEAALRHLFAVIDGEDLDPESGQPHEAHAAACLAIIIDARANGTMFDDRPIPGPVTKLLAEQDQSRG
jgi:hypothetical protein